MGLDATVYCDCLERGCLRAVPRPEWDLGVDESGARYARADDPRADRSFDQWNVAACAHEDGVLLHHWLGNVSAVAEIREALSGEGGKFPLLLAKVVHSGSHCGDHLPVADLARLAVEVGALSTVRPDEPIAAGWVRDFERKMTELVAAARSVGKPISF